MTTAVGPVVDVRSVEDWDAAIQLLQECLLQVDSVVGERWVHRAQEHLQRKLDRQFRDRPAVDSEQAAMVMIRGVAEELNAAAGALFAAAEALKSSGATPYKASQAYQAAQRAKRAALELVDD